LTKGVLTIANASMLAAHQILADCDEGLIPVTGNIDGQEAN